MFKPPAAPVSVLEAPFQITIEFTDYASYQHHQIRRQQYQQQLEIQERNRRHEEHQRQYQAQFQSQIQSQLQSQMQNQFAQHVFQQPFPPQQSPAFGAPFQLPPNLPSDLPSAPDYPSDFPSDFPPSVYSELPARQALVTFPRQERPAHHFSSVDNSPQQRGHVVEAAVHGRSNSLPGTAVADMSAHMQKAAGRGSTPLAHSVMNGFPGHGQVLEMKMEHTNLMHHTGYQAHHSHQASQSLPVNIHNGQAPHRPRPHHQGQLLPATPANIPAPSPIDPLAHTPTAALPTATFPANSPPVCNNSDIQHFSSASPTYFAPPHNHNSTITVAPASSPTVTTIPTTPTSPVSTGNTLRQLSHPRRHQLQLQHHVNYGALNDHQHQSSPHPHPFNYHQHLQQQIQERRLKKAHTFPVVHPGVYAFPDAPQYSSSVGSLPSQLLEQRQQLQQTQIQNEQFNSSQFIYPTFPLAAMSSDYDPVAALDPGAVELEIAAQQAAAQNYQPGNEAPGIDDIQVTETLQQLYTNADLSFVEKTAKLPRAFPLYRPVRGDGNCGWRAIGFCYFELLVESQNAELVTAERNRLHSLNEYIEGVGGYSPYVFEDMVEETDSLFGKILNLFPDYEYAMRAVSEAFNEDDSGNAIIYHLRLLAASYLKEHAEKYEGFLASETGVDGYCQEWIERPNCEIDHLRLELLSNILLKSSDMVLEIIYLDRSESELLPTYRFPESNVGRAESTIKLRMSLLFRPDHYDILYRPSLPSREIAEAVLSRIHTPEIVASKLTLDWAWAATIVAGEPVEVAAEPEPVPQINAPTMDSFPLHQPVASYDDTPDLTPGSSIHSPAVFQAKGEPLTPVLAPSGTLHQVIPSSALSVAVSATADPAPPPTSSAGAGADTVTPTAAIPDPSSSSSRSSNTPNAPPSKRVKLDGGAAAASEPLTERTTAEEQTASTQQTTDATASSSANVSTSNDYKVFHVTNITCSLPPASQPSTPSLTMGADLYAFLYGGNGPSETNSALFGTGNWSSSALRSRHSDSFATQPLAVQQPKSQASSVQVESQPTPVETTAAAAAATTIPASDLMPPPPKPAAKKTEPPKEAQPGTPVLAEVRFTQWHFAEKELSHNAMDRDSTSFRSKIGTQSHFNSNEFQPDMYNPAGGSRRGGRFPKQEEDLDT